MKKNFKGQAAIGLDGASKAPIEISDFNGSQNGKRFADRHLKGQAAMEYLMTYGWAILVLVIVIAALYYFLPKTQETCLFQQSYECEGLPQIYVTPPPGDNNELYVSVKLSNRLGQTVQNITLLCTDAGSGDVTSALFDVAPDVKPMKEQGGALVEVDEVGAGASFSAIAVPCVTSDGGQITSNEGAGFKGILAVQYSLSTDVDKDVKHISTGTVSGTVLVK